MSQYTFRLPDLGEGTVSAELIAWHVKPGDVVAEDQIIAEVMTDKASVELPSPVAGRVLSTAGSAGDSIAVGAEFIVFELAEAAAVIAQPQLRTETVDARPASPAAVADARVESPPVAAAAAKSMTEESQITALEPPVGSKRVFASPSVRRMAREAGIDLAVVQGSGPSGRVQREDVLHLISKPASAPPVAQGGEIEEIPVTGVRRVIAQRMTQASQTIPHFAYAEEVDVTELEALRVYLNARRPEGSTQPTLTFLPFIVTAMVRVLRKFPQCNATYDAERAVILRHRAIHVGIATQTREGLVVPVVRNAEALSIHELAREIARLAAAVRNKKASPKELSGSTITLSSLGRMGGIFSTPIINAPEVAIIGVNKAVDRPVVHTGAIAIRRMMNLSSSFDHRFVDGHDAAAMIQEIKERLEHPAALFVGLD